MCIVFRWSKRNSGLTMVAPRVYYITALHLTNKNNFVSYRPEQGAYYSFSLQIVIKIVNSVLRLGSVPNLFLILQVWYKIYDSQQLKDNVWIGFYVNIYIYYKKQACSGQYHFFVWTNCIENYLNKRNTQLSCEPIVETKIKRNVGS